MSRPFPSPHTTSSSRRTTRSHDARTACPPPCSTAVRHPLLSLALLIVAAVLLLGGTPAMANEDDAIAEAVRTFHARDTSGPGATYLVVGVNKTLYVYSLATRRLVKRETGTQRYGNICGPFASAQVATSDAPTPGRGGLAIVKKQDGRWKVALEGTMFEDDDLRGIGVDKATWKRLNSFGH